MFGWGDIPHPEVKGANNWLASNRICINADKTIHMIFSYIKQLHLTNIKTDIATIEETNSIKFLGIVLDKNLTFKTDINVIARKTTKSVGILFK